MDLAVEGGLSSEGKEVTDCQAGSRYHSAYPTFLSRRNLAALNSSSNGMLGVVFLHPRPVSSLPWTALQEKSRFWGKLRQKGTIHSFIQDNRLRTCTVLQDIIQSCPFPANMCPLASWLHKQEPVCCCPTLNSSFLSITPLWPKWNLLSQQPCPPIALLQQLNNLSLF